MNNTQLKEKEKYAYRFIKRWSIGIVTIEILLLILLRVLYCFDHDEDTMDLIKKFIRNEYELCYRGNTELLDICDSSDSIHELIDKYNSYRLDLELNIEERVIDTEVLALQVLDDLIPSGLDESNNYIKGWIYSWAIHDVRANLSRDAECYYRVECVMLLKLRLHEPYLYRSFHKTLYSNIGVIVNTIIISILLLLSAALTVVIRYCQYYFKLVGDYYGETKMD